VTDLFVASTHTNLLIFTNRAKVYQLKVYQIPLGSRQSRGKPLINLINTDPGDQIRAILPIGQYKKGQSVVMVTRQGLVKKTDIMQFKKIRQSGIIALTIEEGDDLVEVGLVNPGQELILATKNGKAIRFKESQARTVGRKAIGVIGIRMAPGDCVVGMTVVESQGGAVEEPSDSDEAAEGIDVDEKEEVEEEEGELEETEAPEEHDDIVIDQGEATILSVTANGYGKRTRVVEYRTQRRGGKGLISIKATERNGHVVGLLKVFPDDELMIITHSGKVLRTPVSKIRVCSRRTQGVRLMNLEEGEKIVGIERLVEKEESDSNNTDPQLKI
jgi:DNA gyrase subunit A